MLEIISENLVRFFAEMPLSAILFRLGSSIPKQKKKIEKNVDNFFLEIFSKIKKEKILYKFYKAYLQSMLTFFLPSALLEEGGVCRSLTRNNPMFKNVNVYSKKKILRQSSLLTICRNYSY